MPMSLQPLRRLSILVLSCGVLALGLVLGWVSGVVDPPRPVVADRCQVGDELRETPTPTRGGGLDQPARQGRWHRLLPGMFR
jgi:hypothetical protein